MLTAAEMENFKCFSDLRISFGSLTLFTGFNGGGKSTALQPLLVLAQTLMKSADTEAFALNGPLVELGTVADVIPSGANQLTVGFTVHRIDQAANWRFSTVAGERFLRLFQSDSNGLQPDREGVVRGTATAKGRDLSINVSLARLIYLSAVREGTADAYPMPDVDIGRPADVGVDGRYAAYWYDKLVDEEVPNNRLHPKEPATSMRKQVDAWLGVLLPGAQANVQALPQVSLLNLQFRATDIGAWRRPANIGYGFTYAFPIIVALLAAEAGQVVVIDSPEAHLHPFAQSQMGRVLAHFAAAGVQIMVETHSDHLLNGARLAVKEGTLSHDALQIHFFTGAQREGHGVISPVLDPSGGIDEWPDGFFDQSEKDLARLAGWA
jgi:predicted ATPase